MTEGCGAGEIVKRRSNVDLYTLGRRWKRLRRVCYAIGDIVAGLPATGARGDLMEGIIAVTTIAGKPTQPIRKDRIPNATYCEPQIGSIGLTESSARRGYK